MTSKLPARGQGVDTVLNERAVGQTDSDRDAPDEAMAEASETAAPQRRWVKRSLAGLLIVVGLVIILPVAAILTPLGQRYVERAIEAPLLAALQGAQPGNLALDADALETRVRPSSIGVSLVGARLTGLGLTVELDEVDIRVRYIDVLRRNLAPRSIAVGEARVTPLEPATVSYRASATSAQTIDDVEVSAAQVAQTTGHAPSSRRMDAFLESVTIVDQFLTDITLEPVWQSLRTINVANIIVEPNIDASMPLLRDPDPLTLAINRESQTEVVARLTTQGRPDPIRIVVRHAEEGVPEGPAALAERVGLTLRDKAFSHFLLFGLRVSDLTDAFTGNGPVVFDSTLAAEAVVTREPAETRIDEIAALFEVDAGYLVASQKDATILEFVSVPMIYSRESGRFDIISARAQFQETGGVFDGTLGPEIRNGEAGLAFRLEAPRYRLAIPPEPRVGRTLQRTTANIALDAFAPDDLSQIDLSSLELAMGDVRVSYSGLLEMTERGPRISAIAQSTPMRAVHLAAIWPLPMAPNARIWFLENVAEGQIGEGSFWFSAYLNDIEVRDGRSFLDDEMMTVSIPFENAVMRTVGDLPPIFGVDGTATVTGRTVRTVGAGGVGRLPNGDAVTVRQAEFYIGDHAQPNPMASLELTLEGPVSAFTYMTALNPINLEDVPFTADAVSGRAVMTTRLETPLTDTIQRDAVTTTVEAQIIDFASETPIEGVRVTDGQLSLTSDNAGMRVSGRARLDGVATDIDFQTGDGASANFAMRLNAEDRRQMGLDLEPYLAGTVGVNIGGQDVEGRRLFTIDLADAQINIPELGWTKPLGQPGQASFQMLEDAERIQIRDLTLATNGLAVRGNLDLDGGELRNADLESVAIEGIGRFALALTRNASGSAARITGERFVLRPELLRGDREDAGNLTLDIRLEELATASGAALRDVSLTYAQSSDRITAFDMRARHTDGTELVGTLSDQNGAQNLVVSSSNAGTFLRFLGLYQRAEGGRATLVLDPASVGGRLAGQLLLSDFVIVDEPAMESLFSSGRADANAGDIVLPGEFETAERVEIQATRIAFDRTPERLELTQVEGWGPSLGANVRGTIDYEQNRVSLRGTFVPFFTINNVFSRIPILGAALGNRQTEGLLGITFEVVGRPDAPELRINPMSILAPGVMRNIFEFRDQGG
ncbi:MAG: hypothetical protein AAGH43_02100 [Pseudomonadota bacterium]